MRPASPEQCHFLPPETLGRSPANGEGTEHCQNLGGKKSDTEVFLSNVPYVLYVYGQPDTIKSTAAIQKSGFGFTTLLALSSK